MEASKRKNETDTVRLTGDSNSLGLDFMRSLSRMFGGVVCAEISAESLPQEIQQVLREPACICISTPPHLDAPSRLLERSQFELYNATSDDLTHSLTVIAVGGEIELDARELSIIDSLESTFPVAFVHGSSWAYVAYPWDPAVDVDALQCAQMGSGQNYRPVREFQDAEPPAANGGEHASAQSKVRPKFYGQMRSA